MLPALRRQRPEIQAVLAGAGFAALGFAFRVASPWKILLAAAAVGLVAGVAARRRNLGRPELPPALTVVFSVFALGLYVWGFFIRRTPSGSEWIAVVLVLMVPLLLLWRTYRARGGGGQHSR